MTKTPIQIKLDRVENFIREHKLAVVATVNADCMPEAAVVGFSLGDNFKLFFSTSDATRKYLNLETNPRLAAVIGWDRGKTVQYEGEAEKLGTEETDEYFKKALGAVPTIAKYVPREDAVLYRVTPKFVRYCDLSSDPWELFEFQEFD